MDDREEIKVYINSPGTMHAVCVIMLYHNTCAGALSYAALTIVDAMTQLKCPISTVAFGMCGSVASLILVGRPHMCWQNVLVLFPHP